jgi:hypothetical protein
VTKVGLQLTGSLNSSASLLDAWMLPVLLQKSASSASVFSVVGVGTRMAVGI